jgi:hypothetical protein
MAAEAVVEATDTMFAIYRLVPVATELYRLVPVATGAAEAVD